ncbi:MAG TPA: NAD-dependent epimerase/dehydratase family protein, partial [Chitinophagaceae bacterium]|nr:NAD-dependent epimerase/dehydratase family protein [Chitinophagaceae bacterium]
MKTVIVTGAAGNLGQAIVKKFLDEDFTVIGTTTNNDALSFSGNARFESAVVDLANEEETQKF